MTVQAVAFDVDGTLYSNAEMYWRSLPFAVRNARLLYMFRKIRLQIRDVRPVDDFYGLQARMVAEKLGAKEDEMREIIEQRIYRDWERMLGKLNIIPGVVECLKTIKDAGLKLAVASDFPVERKMGLLGLDGWWDYALSTETTGYLKPNPEPFVAISKALAISPEHILYVGNSYECDVIGAKGIGMISAHYTNKHKKNSIADFSFSDYRKLRDWIIEIMR